MAQSERVSYGLLPEKGRLAVLMLARVAEPLVATSIQSCIFFQLRHFNPSASETIIASQAGLLVSSKTAAHVCTGVLWGRLADSKHGGRKPVLIAGLLACAIGILGYGFSQSFTSAMAWQLVDGVLNSSISMVRCMAAEMYPEKRYRSRALTLLPLSACAGMFLGPMIGGFLASNFANNDGNNAPSAKYPFAVPSMLIASYCTFTAILALLVLKEQSDHQPTDRKPLSALIRDLMAALGFKTKGKNPPEHGEAVESEPLLTGRTTARDAPVSKRKSVTTTSGEVAAPLVTRKLPFHRMWTSNVVYTMLTTFMIVGHLGTFTTLWPIFLSASAQSSNEQPSSLHLSGGLAMDRRQVAVCMSFLGLVGVLLQVVIYPSLSDKFGTIRVWRSALWFFPLVYFVAPFCTLAFQESSDPSMASNNRKVLWLAVSFILLLFTVGRTGVTPATSLLINDCTPHPSVRGTIHTTGTVVGNLGKSIFPLVILPVFGYGLQKGMVNLGFWCLAGLAAFTCAISGRVIEGSNGKEIVLEESQP